MKHSHFIAALAITLSTFVVAGGSASAAQLSVVQEIHVTARILPMRRVIVDNNGQILTIMSNTNDDVAPTFFRNKDIPENQLVPSTELTAQYNRLVPAGSGKIGTLYKRGPIAKALPARLSFASVFSARL
ncbi:MAG TPA: hypothetical protein VF575_01075 [Candidatus Saccharimonadales bacterium]|jgi:hypothetical protein